MGGLVGTGTGAMVGAPDVQLTVTAPVAPFSEAAMTEPELVLV